MMPDIITMPDALYLISSQRFSLTTINTTSPASNFNPVPTINGPSAEVWQIESTFMPMEEDQLDELQRFILQLKGGRVFARLYDAARMARSAYPQPKGAGGVGPVVNVAENAAAGAGSIRLKNLIPSQAVSLKAMDYLGIGENLHVVLNPGASNAGGQGLFDIRPALRQGVAEDDPITLLKPTGLFSYTGGEIVIGGGGISQPTTLTFVEVPDFDA